MSFDRKKKKRVQPGIREQLKNHPFDIDKPVKNDEQLPSEEPISITENPSVINSMLFERLQKSNNDVLSKYDEAVRKFAEINNDVTGFNTESTDSYKLQLGKQPLNIPRQNIKIVEESDEVINELKLLLPEDDRINVDAIYNIDNFSELGMSEKEVLELLLKYHNYVQRLEDKYFVEVEQEVKTQVKKEFKLENSIVTYEDMVHQLSEIYGLPELPHNEFSISQLYSMILDCIDDNYGNENSQRVSFFIVDNYTDNSIDAVIELAYSNDDDIIYSEDQMKFIRC
jgi:uncharacterized protein YgiM (DUF1202 family)